MRNFILSFMSLMISSMECFCQHSMLEGNPVWEYIYLNKTTKYHADLVDGVVQIDSVVTVDTLFQIHYLYGQTEKNGHTYSNLHKIRNYKVVSEEDGVEIVEERGIRDYVACHIREDNGRIIIPKGDIEGSVNVSNLYNIEHLYPYWGSWDEELYMNFWLEKGQVVESQNSENEWYDAMTVNDVSYVTCLDGTSRKMMDVSFKSYRNFRDKTSIPSIMFYKEWQESFIDGIGALVTFFPGQTFLPNPEDAKVESYTYLNRFIQNGETIYLAPTYSGDEADMPWDAACHRSNPYMDEMMERINQQTDIDRTIINTKSFGKSAPLFDLQGRQLLHKPEKGLYIQDGKVRMVR